MTTVRVLPGGVDIRVDPGETLLDAALRGGWSWPTNCYGQCRCTACNVTILSGAEHLAAPTEPEAAMLQRLARYALTPTADAPRRLACQIRPNRDLSVALRVLLRRATPS